MNEMIFWTLLTLIYYAEYWIAFEQKKRMNKYSNRTWSCVLSKEKQNFIVRFILLHLLFDFILYRKQFVLVEVEIIAGRYFNAIWKVYSD